MSIKNYLQASESEIVMVFAALIGLVIMIKLVSYIFGSISKSQKIAAASEESFTSSHLTENDMGPSTGQLKLMGVDEKTAAMIMAIVSDESNIPLSELQFKSIKALDK